MAILRVWAHWTDNQPPTAGFTALPVAPFPPSLAGYPLPGGVPQDAGIPVWNPIPTGPTGLPVVAWCALVKQDDINSAHWFGATWPGGPPPAFPGQTPPNQGDEGYGSQAIGFEVTKVTLLLSPNVQNNDFRFIIQGPSGSGFGRIVEPPWMGSFPISVPIPFDGKGIWSIEMERATTPPAPGPTSQSAPALLGVPPLIPNNAVSEPYVIPYALAGEGYLGMEFEGEEIICPTGAPFVTYGICEEDALGNLVVPVTLAVTFTPDPPVGAQLNWIFGPIGSPTFVQDTVTSSPPLVPFQKTVKYPAGSTPTPLVQVVANLSKTICSPTYFTVSVPSCLPCPTLILEDPMERDSQSNLLKHVFGCEGSTARVEFRATINWGAVTSPPPVKYIWTVNTPNGNFEKTIPATTAASVTTDTSAGWEKLPKIAGAVSGPVDLTQAGTGYSVAVSAEVQCPAGSPNSCLPSGCNLLATEQFEIPSCCPTRVANPYNEWGVTNITAPLGPNSFEITGYCDTATTDITLTVDRQGLQPSDLKYTWDFGDGSTTGPLSGGSAPTGQDGEKRTHTFTNPIPGQANTYTIEVTVDAVNCPPLIVKMTLIVPGCAVPPEVTGCSVTAGSPGTITVTFSEDVDQAAATNPGNFAVTVGGAARVPTSLTYAPNTTTINGITINPGETVNVTVTNVPDKAGNVIAGNNSTSCSAGGGSFSLCDALLWIAIVLMVIGAIMVILGCLLVASTIPPPTPATVAAAGNLTFWGVIVFGVGLLVFGFWWLFCRMLTACSVILAVREFVGWLILIFAVIAAVIAVIKLLFPALNLVLCAILAGGFALNWALVYWIINQIAEDRECLVQNPTGGS